MHKNTEIECLRGIAILFTLFHHIAFFLFIHPNQSINFIYSKFTFWGGVDLFFAISGFVIMQSFLRTLKVQNNLFFKSSKIFWIKRIFRILPPAWFWLGVYLFATIFINYTGAFGDITQNLSDAKAAILQYANIYGLSCWGEKSSMACGPNGIYWSLSLEEQFYILLPLVVFVFRKYLAWFLLLVLGAQFFISRTEWTVGWAIRTDALIWGVLIALWSEKLSYKKLRPHFLFTKSLVRWSVLVLCLLLMAYLPAQPNQILLGTSWLGLTCAALVWLASYDQELLFKQSLFKKILVWFGTRSYSLYLIHIIIFRLSYEILYQTTPIGHRFSTEDNYKLLLISLPILLIVSEFSFRFIEKPSRIFGLKLASKFASNAVQTPGL